MTREDRGVIADWVVLISAVLLFGSLFLSWSRLSRTYLTIANQLQTLQGVPRSPTAWQVYSAADIVLALLAAALIVIALVGSKRGQIGALLAAVLALVFTIHAVSVPPTNGAANAFQPSLDVPTYVAPSPTPGPGETVAAIALLAAIAGLGVSLTTD